MPGLPGTPQRDLRIALYLGSVAIAQQSFQCSRGTDDIRDSEVQALGSGWWHRVRRVTNERESSALDLAGDEAAEAQHAGAWQRIPNQAKGVFAEVPVGL